MLGHREWVYVQAPCEYGIAPCHCCKQPSTKWSEWEGHVWCNECNIDYVPSHGGVFDGPIPINVARMLGMVFDRFYINTQTIVKFEDYVNDN